MPRVVSGRGGWPVRSRATAMLRGDLRHRTTLVRSLANRDTPKPRECPTTAPRSHVLRHTFCTYLADADVGTIRELGHADITTII